VKKLLAYSTISQLSYVVLGAALLTPVAIIGAAIHLAVHAVSKITLFFSAGAIQATHHVTAVSDLDGMGRKMPWTMGGFTIGALSMIGVPPTAGFLGKWFILVAAVGQRQWFAVGVVVVSTLLNAGYFLPIVYRAFRRPAKDGHAAPHGDHHGGGEARWPMVVSIGATAAATLLLFIFPDVPYRLGDLLAEGWRYDG
jgi:multicomponent Na+:H+ antiporter subunit D